MFYGPINAGGTPPSVEFLVDNAVSTAAGDLNGDGTDDLVFHSATDTMSPIFLLDMNGDALGGTDGLGRKLPSLLLPSQPTVGNSAGEGSGMSVAFAGTSTYGSVQTTPGAIEVAAQSGKFVLCVTDAAGVTHAAEVAIPAGNDPWAVNGYHHVQAEWSASAGVVSIRAGHPGLGVKQTIVEPPFVAGAVAPSFRLGTGAQNQSRASGFSIDDFRVSTVRRSLADFDADGTQDDFDNCRFLANADQADVNKDGVGDACVFCQTDLGFQGPGLLRLSVCGKPLVSGASAALRVKCGNPAAPFGLFTSFTASPTSALGGTLVPLPLVSSVFGTLGSNGEFVVTVPGFAGPFDLYIQAIALDAAQPAGATLSNAVQIHFP